MKLPDIKILVVGGILLMYGGATAYEKFAPVDYHELGISLIPAHCETVKESFAGLPVDREAQEIIDKACSEVDAKLTDEEYKDEQKELRELKDSRGKSSDAIWEIQRNVLQNRMTLTRMIKDLPKRPTLPGTAPTP